MDTAVLESSGAAAIDMAARQTVAAALSLALRQPSTAGATPAQGAVAPAVLTAAWDLAAAPYASVPASELGLGERLPARVDCAPLADWLARAVDQRCAAWQAVFGLVISKDCPPYETEYCESRDATHRAQHMADLAGFYAAFGLQPDPAHADRLDHITLHLSFVSTLLEGLVSLAVETPEVMDGAVQEHHEVRADGLRSFVRDHIVWWLPAFARALDRRIQRVLEVVEAPELRDGLSELRGVAHLLGAWVAIERLAAGVEPARRIIAPDVQIPEPEDNECAGGSVAEGGCSSCTQQP